MRQLLIFSPSACQLDATSQGLVLFCIDANFCYKIFNPIFFFFSFFFRAHAIEEALRKDRYSAEKGTESTKKGEGEQSTRKKLSPLPFELIINAAQ